MYDLSGELTVTEHYLVFVKVIDRQTVNKHAAQKFDVQIFLRKLMIWRLRQSVKLRSDTALQLWII